MVFGLLSFGFFTSIIQVGNLLRTKLDAAVIGRFLNMDSVGIYGVAALLYGYLLRLIVSCSGVVQPRLAALAGQEEKTVFTDAIIRYSIIVSNLSVALGLVALFLCKDFLTLWTPDNFKDVNIAANVFYILTFVIVLDMMQDVSLNALQAVKKHSYCAYQTIGEGIANLILSILLVVKFGILGVALGTMVPTLITKLIIQPIYCCKIFKIKWSEYMSKVVFKPLLVVGGIIVFLRSSGIVFGATSYPQLIFKGLYILSLYLVISYFFCFDRAHHQAFMSILRGIWFRVRVFAGKGQDISDNR